eukprot:gene3029-3585_t
MSLGVVAMWYGDVPMQRDQHTGISRYQQANDKKYGGNRTAWAIDAIALVTRLGFNTAGPWSDPQANAAAPMYTPILGLTNLGYALPFPDVFEPSFAPNVSAKARQMCTPFKDDPSLLGWYSDNELPWWKNYYGNSWGGCLPGHAAEQQRQGSTNLLTQYLCLPVVAPGRQQAHTYLSSQLAALGTSEAVRHAGAAATRAQTDAPLGADLFEASSLFEPGFAYNVSRACFRAVSDGI